MNPTVKFSFQQYIVCWGKISCSKNISGGGGEEEGEGAPSYLFLSVKLCILSILRYTVQNANLIFPQCEVFVQYFSQILRPPPPPQR